MYEAAHDTHNIARAHWKDHDETRRLPDSRGGGRRDAQLADDSLDIPRQHSELDVVLPPQRVLRLRVCLILMNACKF